MSCSLVVVRVLPGDACSPAHMAKNSAGDLCLGEVGLAAHSILLPCIQRCSCNIFLGYLSNKRKLCIFR